MKLNNKGMTIVEVLICFVIVSIVMMSLFSTISSFNERRIQESYRAKIYTFKNEWTSRIQEDFIRKGLAYAKIVRAPIGTGTKYTVYCTLKTGEKRELVIFRRYTMSKTKLDGSSQEDDLFYLEYGPPGNLFHEELPELGTVNWTCENETDGRSCTVAEQKSSGLCKDGAKFRPCKSQDFQINNVYLEITNENNQSSNAHVLVLYIGFTHPNFRTKYAIDIVAPIDFQGSNIDTSKFFPTTDAASDHNRILKMKELP